MNILNYLNNFLLKYNLKDKKILLAFSSGSDSRALFELLLKLKDKFNFELHLAHIDHSYRKDSEAESLMLKKEMQEKNIFFHLKKIDIKNFKNLEDKFRIERYNFFEELYFKNNFDALLLAHHKNDLAETVLKRLFEGASIFNLTAMKEENFFNKMRVLRPFIYMEKKHISEFLKKNNISYIDDVTNYDTYYLRARMRSDILPYLDKTFGKSITNTLYNISSESNELDEYLYKKLNKYLENIKKFKLFTIFEFPKNLEILEIKYLLKRIAKDEAINLTKDQLLKISEALLKNKANLKFLVENFEIYIDRGIFYIFKKKFDSNFSIQLKEGIFEDNDFFVIKIKKVLKKQKNKNFKDIFLNNLKIYLPEGNYKIGFIKNDKKFSKQMSDNKVPSFIKYLFPVIYDEKNRIYEFFTGKERESKGSIFLEVSLYLK